MAVFILYFDIVEENSVQNKKFLQNFLKHLLFLSAKKLSEYIVSEKKEPVIRRPVNKEPGTFSRKDELQMFQGVANFLCVRNHLNT